MERVIAADNNRAVVNIPVLLIAKDLDSQVLAATVTITMLYWLCAFLKNFLYMMEIKEKYNQNPEETLEGLKREFLNCEE